VSFYQFNLSFKFLSISGSRQHMSNLLKNATRQKLYTVFKISNVCALHFG